jgi:hypothetical protein
MEHWEQDLNDHDREQERFERRLPICCNCGERIYSDWTYDTPIGLYCEDCMDGLRVWTMDLIEED